jgi:hypothetical protein
VQTCNTSKSHFENYVKFSKYFELEYFFSKLLKSYPLNLNIPPNKELVKRYPYEVSYPTIKLKVFSKRFKLKTYLGVVYIRKYFPKQDIASCVLS